MKKPATIIVLASDHGGFRLKEKIKPWLQSPTVQLIDVGSHRYQADDDYPLYATLAARQVVMAEQLGKPALGILLCRSGSGMVIAANKVPGARAVEGFTGALARQARQHNHTNIIALGCDWLSESQIKQIIKAWLTAKPSGHHRHQRRLRQISRLEAGEIEVTPGILEKSLALVSSKIRSVSPWSEWIHIDLADNTLVPNKTFGAVNKLAQIKTRAKRELHLMVKEPLKYLESAVTAGFKRLIIHVESSQVSQCIKAGNQAERLVGLAIDLPTPVAKVKRFIDQIDLVLVMGIKAGFAGRPFQAAALAKVAKLKAWRPHLPVVVDGGVNQLTVEAIAAAGADRVVANSAIFRKPNRARAIAQLTHYRNL